MTRSHRFSSAPHPPLSSFWRLVPTCMGIFFLAMLLRNAPLAAESMSRGLRLCVTAVIPSLFPFMVISELLVASLSRGNTLCRLLDRPFHFLFGLNGAGGCALLLGLLCGFPIGTKCAVSFYRRGAISLGHLTRLLTFCNVPSSAFLISAVGLSLLGNRQAGLLLYFITLLSALLIGLFGRLLGGSLPHGESVSPSPLPHRQGVAVFTGAISSSALSLLSVCAFVVFFTTLSGAVEHVFCGLGLSGEISAFLYGLLELTGGSARAATLSFPLSLYFCAFFAGWSGLSVHMQIMSLCADTGVSFRPYLLAKVIHGLLNVLLLWTVRGFVALLSG